MRIEFQRSGGFAGMLISAVIDTDNLTTEQSHELESLIDASEFFNLPSKIEGSSEGADRFQYSVAITSDGKSHKVDCGEASAPDKFRALLRRLEVLARSA